MWDSLCQMKFNKKKIKKTQKKKKMCNKKKSVEEEEEEEINITLFCWRIEESNKI